SSCAVSVDIHSCSFVCHYPLLALILLPSFTPPATPKIYPLSLHDALPISSVAFPNPISIPVTTVGTGPTRPMNSTGTSSPTRSRDRKSTRLNSSHVSISYAVFCLKKKNIKQHESYIRID